MNNYIKTIDDSKQLVFKIRSILRELMFMRPNTAESTFYVVSKVIDRIKEMKVEGIIWISDGKGYQRIHIEGGRLITAKAFSKLPSYVKEEEVIVIEQKDENELLKMLEKYFKILSIIDHKTYVSMNLDMILKKVKDAYLPNFDMNIQKQFLQNIKGSEMNKHDILKLNLILKDAINILQNEYEETRISGETFSIYLAFVGIMEIIPNSFKNLTDDLNQKLYYLYYTYLTYAVNEEIRVSAILKLLIEKFIDIGLSDEISKIVETFFLKGKELVESAKNQKTFDDFYSTLYKAGPNFYSAIIILKLLEDNPEFEYKRMYLIEQRKNIDEFLTRTFTSLREGKNFDISNPFYNLLQIIRYKITTEGINMTRIYLKEQIDHNYFYPIFVKQVISQLLQKPELGK